MSGNPFQVVLDSSVLVAAVRSAQGASFELLRLVGEPCWQINLSMALLLEYEDAATRQALGLWREPRRLADLLDYLCAHSRHPRIAYAWRPLLPDPNDDMVLELAVAARADCIVTHNLRHFRGAERFSLRIVTPVEFLKTLRTLL